MRVTLRCIVRVSLRLELRLDGVTAIFRNGRCIIRRFFNSNNFATSAALAEVCALLGVILMTVLMLVFVECFR